jgi:HEAT repeat protein
MMRALGGRLVICLLVVAPSEARSGKADRTQRLLCRLGDPDPKVRGAAADALAARGRKRDVLRALLFLGWDRSDEVRARAADALGRIGRPALPQLIKRLGSRHENTRELAIRALGKMGATAVRPLLRRLKDEKNENRHEAAWALGQIGAPAVPGLLRLLRRSEGRVRREVALALSLNRSTPLKAVKALLRDKDPRIVALAVMALGNVGRRAIPMLARLLSHRRDDIAGKAAQALVETGHIDAVDTLTEALLRGPPRVRSMAVHGFFYLKRRGAPAVTALEKALASKNADLRHQAVYALRYIGRPAAAALVKGISSADPLVREQAAAGLGDLGPAGAAGVSKLRYALLNDVICHDRPRPRWRSRRPRRRRRRPPPICVFETAAKALARIGPKAVSALVAGLKHRVAEVRGAAALELAWGVKQLGPGATQAAAALLRLLRDSDQDVSWRAATALGCLGPAAARAQARALARLPEDLSLFMIEASCIDPPKRVPLLVLALKSRHRRVRVTAASALVRAGRRHDLAVPVLVNALGSEKALREMAERALDGVGSRASGSVPALRRMLRNRSSRVRSAAAGALGDIGPAAAPAAPALVGLLRNDPELEVRRAAAWSLGAIGPKAHNAKSALVSALAGSDAWLSRTAAVALGKVARSGATVRVLRALLGNRSEATVRAGAAEGLGLMGTAAAAGRADLIAALGDPDWTVREAATLALGRIGPDPASLAALGRALATNSMSDAYRAAEALGLMGARAAPATVDLVAALSSKESNVRAKAAEALGRIGATSAIASLHRILEDEEASVRKAAAEALKRIGGARCRALSFGP